MRFLPIVVAPGSPGKLERSSEFGGVGTDLNPKDSKLHCDSSIEFNTGSRAIDLHGCVGRVLLPTPGIHLLELAAEPRQNRGRLKALLRGNPALFIFGLSSYFTSFRKPPRSIKRLIGWLDGRMSDLIGGGSGSCGSEIGSDLDVGSCVIAHIDSCDGSLSNSEKHQQLLARLRPALKQFVCAGSNKELKRTLVQFLVAATGTNKKEAKKWVSEIVGKRLNFQRSSSKKQKARLRATNEDWKIALPTTINVDQLFRFRRSHEMTESEFNDRLHVEKLDSMKQLAYGASHEINNPLANIATRAQTLMADESSPERKNKLAVIYEQAMRAHEMISDMMLFGNPPKLSLASTDLRLLVARIVKEITPELNSKTSSVNLPDNERISLEVRIGPDVKNLVIDSTQISVALKAIIRNSIDAIKTKDIEGSAKIAGAILLRIEVNPCGDVAFAVTDNGVGISESVRKHLFDPFYSGREAGRGLGFGLSKAWRIARLHLGDLRFDKNHQPGARFVLTVPTSRLRIARIDNSSAA